MEGLWKRTLNLDYRIDYNYTGTGYNKQLQLGKKGIIILNESYKEGTKTMFTNEWSVTLREYKQDTGNEYTELGNFDSKAKAISFAKSYMKNN